MSGIYLNPVIFASSPIVLVSANHNHKTQMSNAAWLTASAVSCALE